MLREIEQVTQVPGESRRRWFAGDGLDLIVWLSDIGEIEGFQLCYPKGGRTMALTYRKGNDTMHEAVDEGEDRPLSHKMTPVLLPDGDLDPMDLLHQFDGAGGASDASVSEFVRGALSGMEPL